MLISVKSVVLENHVNILKEELKEALIIKELLEKSMQESIISMSPNGVIISNQLNIIENQIESIKLRIDFLENTIQRFIHTQSTFEEKIMEADIILRFLEDYTTEK